ncbi:MAG: hypothetical protein KKA84_14935 [Bacteroidetes bacterium]|nr:hypothetical protein [Bacteroidota bacterium]
MKEDFIDTIFNEYYNIDGKRSNVIKSAEAAIAGKTKISVEEESFDGVKIVLKKGEDETLKEIKFICSCGQTKSVLLDYSE